MINPRRYSAMLYRRTDEDYLPATLEALDVYHPTIRPTISDVTWYVSEKFPGMEIDTRWESLRDMLETAREYGYFSVSLRKHGEPAAITYKLSFLEI